MLTTLAQQANNAANSEPANNNVFDIVTGLFSKADFLAHPGEIVPRLESMGVIWAVVFLTAGILCMFNGFKYYKVVVVLLAMLIGLFVGYALGEHLDAGKGTNAPYIVSGCGAALLAVVCFPLMKYAVAVIGGIVGAFMGANTWSAITIQMGSGQNTAATEHYWVGALIGLLVVGMLAFILFKLAIVTFTSVSGSTLAVLGGVALLLEVPAWRDSVGQSIQSNAIIVPLLVLVPALIGLIHQESQRDDGELAEA